MWAHNDYLVFLVFRSKSIAILNRLGSLVSFVNPNLAYVSNAVEDAGKYNFEPRKFNEIIYPR